MKWLHYSHKSSEQWLFSILETKIEIQSKQQWQQNTPFQCSTTTTQCTTQDISLVANIPDTCYHQQFCQAGMIPKVSKIPQPIFLYTFTPQVMTPIDMRKSCTMSQHHLIRHMFINCTLVCSKIEPVFPRAPCLVGCGQHQFSYVFVFIFFIFHLLVADVLLTKLRPGWCQEVVQ